MTNGTPETTTSRGRECIAGHEHQPYTLAFIGGFRTMCEMCGQASDIHPTAGASVSEYVETIQPDGAPLMLTNRSAYIGQRVEVWQDPRVQPVPFQGETGTIRGFASFGINKPAAAVEVDGYGLDNPTYIPLGHLIRTGQPDEKPQPDYASPVEISAIEKGVAEYLRESAEMEGGISVDDGMDRGERLELEGFEIRSGENGIIVHYRDRYGRPMFARLKVSHEREAWREEA